MPTLLVLNSSADLEASRSRAMTGEFSRTWASRGPEFSVISRDLHRSPLPHFFTPGQHWVEAQRGEDPSVPDDLVALQREILDELLGADVIVIGAPMYNYSMPSTLKAWVDLIHLPGLTAALGGSPQPLAGRRAVIVTSRGGAYDEGTLAADRDHVVPPLRLVLELGLGMTVDVVVTTRTLADRIPALDSERAQAELEAALAECRRLAVA